MILQLCFAKLNRDIPSAERSLTFAFLLLQNQADDLRTLINTLGNRSKL